MLTPSLAHFVWLCTPSPGATPADRESRIRGVPRLGRAVLAIARE
jgi:hypothetical protein